MLEREIRVWSALKHPNVLKFLGFILEDKDCPLLISEWMENGTVNRYLKDRRDTDYDVIKLVSVLL